MALVWNGRKVYMTRSNLRTIFRRPKHPWLNHPLPGPTPRRSSRPRGAAARGHSGALFGEEYDLSGLPDPGDEPFDLGDLMYPGDQGGSATTHVRVVRGGYVDLMTREDAEMWNSEGEKKKRRAAALLKKRRAGMVGSTKRRWAWKNEKLGKGRKGKKVARLERMRGADGRFKKRGV